MFGSQTFVNVVSGVLYEQEGGGMKTNEWGYDSGERHYLTHPSTPLSAYPQRNQRDAVFGNMFVRDVIPREHESGLIELTATFKGLKSTAGVTNKERILPGNDVTVMSIGILSSGTPMTLLAPIPKNTLTREFVTTSTPGNGGVGQSAGGSFLPAPSGFSITFVADPDASPPPKNYTLGWVLDSRTWDDVAGAVFLVRERYGYYLPVGT